MYYIVDENKSRKRPKPSGYGGAGLDLLCELGPLRHFCYLISKEAPPAWRKFAKAGSADEKTIKKMIERGIERKRKWRIEKKINDARNFKRRSRAAKRGWVTRRANMQVPF